MTETLLFLCTLCILTPFLVAAVVIYNLRRQMKGLNQVSGGDALQDMIQQLINKTKDQGSQKKSQSKATKKVAEQKPEAEDAEFRDA